MRCGRTPTTETKVCPVCDATIDAGVRNCPSCLTDLSLFDVHGPSDEAVGVPGDEGKSIDDILASIMEGRTDRPEIFETLKTVGTTQPPPKETAVESKRPPLPARPAVQEAEEQFLCPVCDSVVHATDTVCPGCGAEFSEGEATEYECPVCRAAVPADAAKCPSCGVVFEAERGVEEALEPAGPPGRGPSGRPAGPAAAPPAGVSGPPSSAASLSQIRSRVATARGRVQSQRPELSRGDVKLMARELPKLVNDVKPLLVSAKRIGLDIEKGKRLINDAVMAGKKRDIERAVQLIADARRSLDVAFVEFLGAKVDAFAAEIEKAHAAPGAANSLLLEAVSLMEKGEYDGSWDRLQQATDAFHVQASEYSEAQGILDGDARLVGEVRTLGMDVGEVERLAKQSRDALDRHDLAAAVRLAKESHDRLERDVPLFVDDQMKQARNLLLDLKVRGVDTTKPVSFLKEASTRAKGKEWNEALRFLREFRKEAGRAPKA